MAKLNFNATAVDTADNYEPMPVGDYAFGIIEADISPNKKGTGHYLKVVLSCLEEEYNGKRVYDYINYEHQNEKVQQIGQRQLAELCQACGIMELEDTEELVNHQVTARIAIDAGNEQFGPSNKVKKYLK